MPRREKGHKGYEGAVDPAPYTIEMPVEQSVPIVYDSPHSGSFYPASFLAQTRLDTVSVRRSEDMWVDTLFKSVVALGAPLLSAVYPRAFLDVNREPFELDPSMFSGKLPPFANVRSLRVAGGLGTIPRVVSDAQEIYRRPMPVADALGRIETIYKPYHEALRGLLGHTHAAFGWAVLIDCHSMPSTLRGGQGRVRPDFVLGDRFGTTCAADLIDFVAATLTGLGYTVSRNKPYAGGFITEHYGRPVAGLHSLQIEVNRALYMEEDRLEPNDGFECLVRDVTHLAAQLADAIDTIGEPARVAAE